MTTVNTNSNQPKFSFAFDGGRKSEQRDYASNQGSSVVRKTTQRQIDYYVDLCAQRRVAPQNYVNMTYEELDKIINDLRKFYPASEKQLTMIHDKIANLQELGMNINQLSPNESVLLTGGRDGSASALINNLIKKEKEYADQMQPTNHQLEFMVTMFLCPDVPFEDFKISRHIALEDDQWRYPTPDEFANDIKSHMTKSEASKFIDDYRGAFHIWTESRIRPEQMNYIKQLEERMANVASPVVVEWAVDQQGNLKKIVKHLEPEYNPQGYQPLTDMQLMMFSKEQASKYIDTLKAEELQRKNGFRLKDDEERNLQVTSEDKVEEIRTVANQTEAIKHEFIELQNLMFKLEKVAGYEDPDLHNSVTSLLTDEYASEDWDNVLTENKSKIKEFMTELVETGAIDFEGLVELIKDSSTAIRILIGK